jgi:hypothetical protein
VLAGMRAAWTAGTTSPSGNNRAIGDDELAQAPRRLRGRGSRSGTGTRGSRALAPAGSSTDPFRPDPGALSSARPAAVQPALPRQRPAYQLQHVPVPLEQLLAQVGRQVAGAPQHVLGVT